jgi:hypothetical protein
MTPTKIGIAHICQLDRPGDVAQLIDVEVGYSLGMRVGIRLWWSLESIGATMRLADSKRVCLLPYQMTERAVEGSRIEELLFAANNDYGEVAVS